MNDAKIDCDEAATIIKNGHGYQLSNLLSVELDGRTKGSLERRTENDPDDPDDPNFSEPDEPDRDDPKEVARRREWILNGLALGRQLRARDVSLQFQTSLSTSKRDYKALKVEGKIRFIGNRRTGYYRLQKPRAQADD